MFSQFLNWSAVNPEKFVSILRGIRPTSVGTFILSTDSWIFAMDHLSKSRTHSRCVSVCTLHFQGRDCALDLRLAYVVGQSMLYSLRSDEYLQPYSDSRWCFSDMVLLFQYFFDMGTMTTICSCLPQFPIEPGITF